MNLTPKAAAGGPTGPARPVRFEAGSLVDRELMAPCNDFELQRQTRPERRGEKAGQEQEKRSHAHFEWLVPSSSDDDTNRQLRPSRVRDGRALAPEKPK